MSFVMQPAKFPKGGWIDGGAYTPATDQTFSRGTPVTWDTSGEDLNEFGGGSTVTDLLGIAMSGVTTTSVDDPSGKVDVCYAAHPQVFMAKLTNNAGVEATVDTGNLHVQYGIVGTGSGRAKVWSVDESDTTHVVCEVIGIDTDRNIVFFKFLNSAVQLSGTL